MALMAENYCERLTLQNVNDTNSGEILLMANSPKY